MGFRLSDRLNEVREKRFLHFIPNFTAITSAHRKPVNHHLNICQCINRISIKYIACSLLSLHRDARHFSPRRSSIWMSIPPPFSFLAQSKLLTPCSSMAVRVKMLAYSNALSGLRSGRSLDGAIFWTPVNNNILEQHSFERVEQSESV